MAWCCILFTFVMLHLFGISPARCVTRVFSGVTLDALYLCCLLVSHQTGVQQVSFRGQGSHRFWETKFNGLFSRTFKHCAWILTIFRDFQNLEKRGLQNPRTFAFKHLHCRGLTWKVWAGVMMSARPAGQLSLCGKNFDVAIFFLWKL